MGWEGYHLYQFVVSGMEYGDPRMLQEMEGEDARRVTLATLVRGEKCKFLYESAKTWGELRHPRSIQTTR